MAVARRGANRPLFASYCRASTTLLGSLTMPLLNRRALLAQAGTALTAAAVGATSWNAATGLASDHDAETGYDLVVIGGTPGGIATAVTAARLGRKVALAEYHAHLGGMSSSGLGKSDIEHRPMIQGIFREFVDRVKQHYLERYGESSEAVRLCRDGYFYEPSVAEAVFEAMIAEQPSITVYKQHRLEGTTTRDGRLVAVRLADRTSGKEVTLRGKLFADATYEGDVYAAAGASFRMGREGRDEFGEPHAGEIYFDWRNHQHLGGSGSGDRRLPAYTYRLCLATDPGNQVPVARPEDYDRRRYLGYLDDWRSGRFGKANAARIALSIAPIPNAKTDVNMNPRGLGFVFAEENAGYVDGSWQQREAVCQRLRSLTLGLLWFLQHDRDVPEDARQLALAHQLPRDEFADNGHFPFQLYVREARRLVGAYTLTEANITEQPALVCVREHADAIAVGEFPIDSFPVRKRQPGDDRVLEGYLCMLHKITRPYQIPYRIMIPEKLEGLIVPVAASTTHVAFSSIRLEPTWMAMGQAAGVAAHVALDGGAPLRSVSIQKVQGILRQQGAVLTPPA